MHAAIPVWAGKPRRTRGSDMFADRSLLPRYSQRLVEALLRFKSSDSRAVSARSAQALAGTSKCGLRESNATSVQSQTRT